MSRDKLRITKGEILNELGIRHLRLLIEARGKHRENGEWKEADEIRDTLLDLGIKLKDKKEGTTWGWVRGGSMAVMED